MSGPTTSTDEKLPSEQALDEIAVLCGCAEWDYPGQVIRDVQQVVAGKAAALEAFAKERAVRLRLESGVRRLLQAPVIELGPILQELAYELRQLEKEAPHP